MSYDELVDFLTRRSPALALQVNEPFVNLLVVARELCGDDLDAFLVFMVVIQRANRHPDFKALDPRDFEREPPKELPSLTTNFRSIAESTGIPKETVRRKARALAGRGLIAINEDGIRYSPEGYVAAAPAREAIIKLGARIYTTIAAELSKPLD